MAPPLLTTREVALRARFTAETVRRLVRDGDGPAALRFGGRLRFRPEAVEAWLDGAAVVQPEREAA